MKTISIMLFTISFLFLACNSSSNENSKEVIGVTTIGKNQPHNSKTAEIDYLKTGEELALQTKSSLAKYLVSAIGKKGSEGAVEFCNTQAIPITDSMSLVLKANIKRVSDQPRNPANSATSTELAYIKKWKEAKAKGVKQSPIVTEINGKMVGYYPIITNQMCLQCHGKPEIDISVATLNKINTLYPTDKATGYAEDEIRGIFVVEMNKN